MKAEDRTIKEAERGVTAAAGRGKAAVLQPANHVPNRVAEDQLARERKYAAKLEDARQVALRLSQTAAERERAFAARLHDAQQTALQMSRIAAERAQNLSAALKASHEALTENSRAAAERDRELADLRARLVRVGQLFNPIQQALVDISRTNSVAFEAMPTIDVRPSPVGAAQLLAVQGRDFVVHAYRMLLHRDPDQGGLEHYLGELGKGVSKMEIIRRIRYSPEGKNVAADVRGIRARLALAFLYRTPFFGRLFEAIGDAGSLFAIRRERRVFEYVVVQKLEQAQSANRELREHVFKIEQLIARFDADVLVQPPTRRETDGLYAKLPNS